MTSAFAEWVRKHEIIQANYWQYPKHTPEGTLYDGVMGTVGDGWVSILDALATRLIALGWDRKLLQVREKFGVLHFYPESGCTHEMLAAIEEADALSAITCEDCGEPGVAQEGDWTRTLCDACQVRRGGQLPLNTRFPWTRLCEESEFRRGRDFSSGVDTFIVFTDE
jgi:hypothetical protein